MTLERKNSLLKKFIWNSLVVFTLLNSGGALNWLFQIVLGKTLSPDQYGSFNSLLSMIVLISAPITIMHVVFSRFIATISTHGLQQIKTLLIKTSVAIFSAIGIIILIGLLTIPWLKNFLHVKTTLPIILMLLAASSLILQQVLVATCEGMHRFSELGIISSGMALTRFICALIFVVVFGWGVEGGLLAVACAGAAAIGYGTYQLRDVFRSQATDLPPETFKKMARYSVPAFLMTMMVMLLINIDIILVRHYCSPDQAGYYATAAILGRIAFLLPATLLMVLFPSVAKATTTGDRDEHYLWVSLGLTTILSGVIFLALFFWGKTIIHLFYDAQYYEAAPILRIVAAAMGLLAISHVIFSYNLARSEFGFLWPLVGGVILMLFLVFLYHDTAETIAWILLLSTGTIFLGTVLNRVYLFFSKLIVSN